jgi:hypothetical protein
VAVAAILPYTPLAGPLGFTALPPAFLLILAGLVVVYLALVEATKRTLFGRRTCGGRCLGCRGHGHGPHVDNRVEPDPVRSGGEDPDRAVAGHDGSELRFVHDRHDRRGAGAGTGAKVPYAGDVRP